MASRSLVRPSVTDELRLTAGNVTTGANTMQLTTIGAFTPAATTNTALTVGGTTVTFTSTGTPVQNGDVIQINNEWMLVTAGGGTTSLTVTRGFNGTTAATHLIAQAINRVPIVARISGHVIGTLQKAFPIGTPSLTFEVGSGSTYAPATITFASTTAAGALGASTAGTQQPNYATSGLSQIRYVNRYWTLTQAGGTFTTYGGHFTFAQIPAISSGPRHLLPTCCSCASSTVRRPATAPPSGSSFYSDHP